jgi:hypothetical protein
VPKVMGKTFRYIQLQPPGQSDHDQFFCLFILPVYLVTQVHWFGFCFFAVGRDKTEKTVEVSISLGSFSGKILFFSSEGRLQEPA